MKKCLCCKYCTHCLHHKGAGPFFGRLLIALIFLIGGIDKFIEYSETVEGLRQVSVTGAEATFYIAIGALMEIIGALLIILGFHTRVGVWLLMIFLLPTTIIYHGFWRFQGMEAQIQLIQFMKNIVIYGGLILIHSFGPGRWSLDAKRIKDDSTNQQSTKRW